MRRLLPILTALLVAAACGGNDSMMSVAGTGGIGGMVAGTVAGTGGVGGMVAGTMAAGTGGVGGMVAGTMAAGTGGVGGMVAGTMAAGTGGMASGTGGMGATGIKTCADYAASGAPRGTKDAVAMILRGTPDTTDSMVGSCAFMSCHNNSSMATLDLDMPDIGTALVNVPACQVEGWNRVTPGNPAMSWIWIKLTGPFDASGNVQNPATPKACPDTPAGTLGGAMPWTGGASIPLPDDQLYQICTWIEDGAM